MASIIGVDNLRRRHNKLEKTVGWLAANPTSLSVFSDCLGLLFFNAQVFVDCVPADGNDVRREWHALQAAWQRGLAVVINSPLWDDSTHDFRQEFLRAFVKDHPEFVDQKLGSELQHGLTHKRQQIAQTVAKTVRQADAVLDAPVSARPQPILALRSALTSAVVEARRWGVPCADAIDTQRLLDRKLLAWTAHHNTYITAHLDGLSLVEQRRLLDDCRAVERLLSQAPPGLPIVQSFRTVVSQLAANVDDLERMELLLTALSTEASTLSVLHDQWDRDRKCPPDSWRDIAQAGCDYVATLANLGSFTLDDLIQLGSSQSRYGDQMDAVKRLVSAAASPGAAAPMIVAWLCDHDPADCFTAYAQGIKIDHRPTVWESAFLAHFRARRDSSLAHRRLHGLALNSTPRVELLPGDDQAAIVNQLPNTTWVDAIPTDWFLSPRQREELLTLIDVTTEQLRHAMGRPPDGWRAVIADEPFRSWGWQILRVQPVPFAWGRVVVTGSTTGWTLTVGPDTQPDLTRDGSLLAYAWILSWVDAVSRREALIPVGAAVQFRHPSNWFRRIGQRTAVHRVLGRSTRRLARSRNRAPVGCKRGALPHPVASYRRFVRPDFVADPYRHQLAREALVELPPGYTFVPHHWSPRRFDPETAIWVRVRWDSSSAMHAWRRIAHGVGPDAASGR